jgi:hypothetical protein
MAATKIEYSEHIASALSQSSGSKPKVPDSNPAMQAKDCGRLSNVGVAGSKNDVWHSSMFDCMP